MPWPALLLLPLQHTTSDAHSITALTIGAMRIRTGVAFSIRSIPRAVVGTTYPPVALPITANGVDPVKFYFGSPSVGGGLPAGLSLDARTGVISGTPAAHGAYQFLPIVGDTRVPVPGGTTVVSFSIAMAGDVVMTTDFASPLSSQWLLQGATVAPLTDAFGSFLRLKDRQASTFGSAEYRQPFDLAAGLDIRFVASQFTGTGGDGIIMYLRDGSSSSTAMGATMGGLGYAPDRSTDPPQGGMPDALVGIAMSVYGEITGFSRFGGPDCAYDGTTTSTLRNNYLAVRGGPLQGNTSAGYCREANIQPAANYFGYPPPMNVPLNMSRSSAANGIRVILDPPSLGTARKLRVYTAATGIGQDYKQLFAVNISASPSLAALAAASSAYLGFAASSGPLGADTHAISNLEVATLSVGTRRSIAAGTTWVSETFPAGWASQPQTLASWVITGAVVPSSDVEGTFLQLTNAAVTNTVAAIETVGAYNTSHGLDIRFVQAQVSPSRRLQQLSTGSMSRP